MTAREDKLDAVAGEHLDDRFLDAVPGRTLPSNEEAAMSGERHDPQNFLADLDEPEYDLVERPGTALASRLTCIRCRGPRSAGDALCCCCRWSVRRLWRTWRNR